MSKERMQDLRQLLLDAGWEIINEKGDSDYSEDIFHVDDEIIIWGLFNRDSNKILELEFRIFDHLGRRSNELNDILYCVLKSDEKLKLYFDKRNSEEWQKGIKAFVNSLKEKL